MPLRDEHAKKPKCSVRNSAAISRIGIAAHTTRSV